jgi:hypothetical protein
MNLNAPVPVRFTERTAARLKAVAESSGIPVARLVRLATERYLAEVESDQSITIPLAQPKGTTKSSAKK